MERYTTPLMHVFIDETGSLMSGTNESNLYICTAVIVSDSNKQKIIDNLQTIKQKHKVGAVLKSSDIGSDHKRRIAILQDLISLDFTYGFLMTDKSKIAPNSGLQYKKSRYKFIHNKLNKLIEDKHCDLCVVIDQYGTSEFQDECLKYYEKKVADLFGGEVSYIYADDKKQTILQIADFIGGSLLYCFDKDRKNEYSENIREILHVKEVGCDFFPRGILATISARPIPDSKLEEELYRHLYNKAVGFLDETENSSDLQKQMQSYTLSSLFMARCYEPIERQWIYSDKLFNDLLIQGFEVKKRAFTVNIIGGLRRKGIIIAGSPNGYKLALTLDDINNYLIHDSNIIFPMLDKLKMAKDLVQSLIGYNILHGEYARFDKVLNALTAEQIRQYTAEPDIEKIEMIQEEEAR